MPVLLVSLPAEQLERVLPYREEIERLAPAGMRVVMTHDRQEIEALLADVEIVAGGLPPELLARSHHLRWYQQWGAGADWLLKHPDALPEQAVLTNMSGLHAVQISEQILAYLLAFARALPLAFRAQREHQWRPAGWNELFELPGKTMLLLGLGGIGGRTARMAAALGMHVIGVRSHPTQPVEGVSELYGPEKLPELWSRADFVVLTIPLTPETRCIINRQVLRAMKPGAYLINIGRGGLVDEEALIEALQNGWIAGAGLDVFAREPLPPDSPLWGMPNVIITAHYAGRTPHHERGAMAIFLDNLQRYTAQQSLRNVVDRQRGY